MKHYFYDLHTHSALSPCGDNFMTPNNLAGFCIETGNGTVVFTDVTIKCTGSLIGILN